MGTLKTDGSDCDVSDERSDEGDSLGENDGDSEIGREDRNDRYIIASWVIVILYLVLDIITIIITFQYIVLERELSLWKKLPILSFSEIFQMTKFASNSLFMFTTMFRLW